MKFKGKDVNIHPGAALAFIMGLVWIAERVWELWFKH